MDSSQAKRLVSSVWFKLNVNQSSLVRVNYDQRNWEALTELLIKSYYSNHLLGPLDRANLLDDALSLMRCGRVSVPIAMNLTLYLEVGERDYQPWMSALRHLDQMQTLLNQQTASRATSLNQGSETRGLASATSAGSNEPNADYEKQLAPVQNTWILKPFFNYSLDTTEVEPKHLLRYVPESKFCHLQSPVFYNRVFLSLDGDLVGPISSICLLRNMLGAGQAPGVS